MANWKGELARNAECRLVDEEIERRVDGAFDRILDRDHGLIGETSFDR
jgi:hypothetical protein